MVNEILRAYFGTFGCPYCQVLHGAIICRDESKVAFKSKAAGFYCVEELLRTNYIDQSERGQLTFEIDHSAMLEASDDPIDFWPSALEDSARMLRPNVLFKINWTLPDGNQASEAQAAASCELSTFKLAHALS